MPKKEVYEAIATLVGTVIGAGVLGIPYVIAQAGFLTGLLDLLLLGVLVTVLYLFYGEVILRTKGIHQLTGYAEKYLGKTGKWVATATMVVGVYGALIAYIMGVGASLSSLFGGQGLIYSILFFLISSAIVYIGIKAIEKIELFLVILIIIVIFVICIFSFKGIEFGNVTEFSAMKIFLPYGVILFAYLGTAAIPEMREELVKNGKKLKQAIIIGMIIPIVIYSVFSFVVVGVVGISGFNQLSDNNKIATIALGSYVGANLAVLGNLFAVLAMTTSFLALGLALQELFIYDLKLKKQLAFALTFIIPLIVALNGITNFIQIIGVSGVIVGGVNGGLIVIMHQIAKKKGSRKPEYTINTGKAFALILIIFFLFGIITKILL